MHDDAKRDSCKTHIFDQIIGSKIPRTVYHNLIKVNNVVCKYAGRWYQKHGIWFDTVNYQRCFLYLHKLTRVTKYKDFQYRLLLMKIPTNVDLCKWKLKDNDQCTFCGMMPETLAHLFIDCEFVK